MRRRAMQSANVIIAWLLSATAVAAQPPTVATVFDEYCKQPDSSQWFCGTRKFEVPDSQKWEIVEAYCFDDVNRSRPVDEGKRKAAVDILLPKASTRRDVCSAHIQVVPPLALEFNHRKMEWLDKNKGFEARGRRLELDPVSRTPTAHLVNGDVVGIVILETNPALFLANRGEAKEDNIDQIKSLEQVLALLGTSLGGLVGDLQRLNIRTTDQIRSYSADKFLAMTPRRTDADVFLGDLERLKDVISKANTSHQPIRAKLKSLVEHRERLQLVAQQLEHGPARLKGALDQTLEDPGAWHTLFVQLAKDGENIPGLERCEPVLNAFGPIVSTKPDEPVAVHAATLQFLQLFETNSQDRVGSTRPCSELNYIGLLEAAATAIQDAARAAARNPSDPALAKALRDSQADGRERHLQHALILAGLVRQVAAIRQGFKDTAGKEEETRKAALVLGLIANRVRDAAIRRVEPDELVVTNRIFVQDEVYSSAWTKVRTTPLRIVVNSPIADAVPNQRAKETTTSYRFVRRGFDKLTFGVGILYTPAYNATYTALDPDPSVNQTQTTTTSTGGPPPAPVETTQVVRPELKQIVEKDRQPRAGSYGAFVNYRVWGSSAFGLGGQFGVGLSADNPAFLGGGSVNLSRFVTLGVGVGSFRLKRLSAAQSDTSFRVASADEIRIDSRWDEYGYISLSVNLSGLPLFK